MQIPLEKIVPNPDQPRTEFNSIELQSLASSMEQHGLINPIAVEAAGDWYIIQDGERRWRAAQILAWETIEANVRPVDSQNGHHRLILALVGNLQRADMGPVDEAHAFARLRESMSAEEIAEKIGRSASHVSARLRMLDPGLAPVALDLLNRHQLPIDYDMLRLLRQLPEDQQTKIVRRAATNKTSASAIRGICSRLLRATPFRSATHRKGGTKPGATVAPALAVHNITLPEEYAGIVELVIRICDRCGMSEDTAGAICRDCPLATLMAKIAEDNDGEEAETN